MTCDGCILAVSTPSPGSDLVTHAALVVHQRTLLIDHARVLHDRLDRVTEDLREANERLSQPSVTELQLRDDLERAQEEYSTLNEEMRSRIEDLQELASALTDVEDYAACLENTLIVQEARIRRQQVLIQVAATRQADLMADYDSLLDANRRRPRVSDCQAIRDRYDARQQVRSEQALDSSLPRLRAHLVPDIVDLTSSRTGTASTEEDDHNSSEQDAARALLYYANLTVEESPQELMTIPQFENRVNELLERQTNVRPPYTRSRRVRLRADSVDQDETSSPRSIRSDGKRRIRSTTRTDETRRTRLREASEMSDGEQEWR